MECRNCGSRIEGEAEACPFCNHVLRPPPAAPKPAAAPPPPKPAPPSSPPPATPVRRRRPFILIVDDDESFSRLMADFLESQGVERCTQCADVKQALIQAESIDVGLVLMDVMLPAYGSGLDGYRMLRSSPYLPKDLPILFVTAMPPEKFQALLPRDPRVTVVFKPVELPELAQQIRRLTGDLFLRDD